MLFAHFTLNLYIENAEKIFKVPVESNPEAFPLLKTQDIAIYSLYFDEDFFPSTSANIFFIRKKDTKLSFNEYDVTNKDYYTDHTTTENDVVIKALGINKNDIIQYFTVGIEPLKLIKKSPEIIDTYKEIYKNLTKRWLTNEARDFQSHISKPIGYYAKNAARYSYSLLDLGPLIKKVNDEDFSYQMDQAIAAYDSSLYLASCATLGVCLETLCKLLLIRNGVKVKDSDPTMLDKLSERLKENQLINYKFKQRIDVCYKVRNISSHTSPGKVVQNDCHFIINTIHEIVDSYF
jgi:hypothetical protein